MGLLHLLVTPVLCIEFIEMNLAQQPKGHSLIPDVPCQVQVEECFLQQSALKPRAHKLYWMGLVTGQLGAVWPNFTWTDKGQAIYVGNYQHWGTYVNTSGG